MANKTISDLRELSTVSDNNVLVVETNNETFKVTKENLLKEVNTRLNTKSNVKHTHNEYITESALNAKGLATETFVTQKIEEVDLSNYQTKEDDALTTTSKTIVEAINEINASLKQLLEKQ